MCIGDLYSISDYFYIYSVQAVVTVKEFNQQFSSCAVAIPLWMHP